MELLDLNIRPTVVHFIECMKRVVTIEHEMALGKAWPPNDADVQHDVHRERKPHKKMQKGPVTSFTTQVSSSLIETEEPDPSRSSAMDSSSTGIGGDNVPTCQSE